MRGRGAWALGLAFIFFVAASTGEARPSAQALIPVPSAGNVTVARLAITATAGKSKISPRLALASGQGLPATAYVAATVSRSGPGRFQATVAVFSPAPSASPQQPASAKVVAVRLPQGFTLAARPQVARDVLYTNPIPSFRLLGGGVGSILAGANPPRLPPARIVGDAQQLAFERSVPLVDVGLLGLEYVAAQFSRLDPTTLKVTLGLYLDTQVNAIELRFPDGTTVDKVSAPADADALLLGTATRLVASSGFYTDGVAYSFTVHLSRPLKKGDFVALRASAHYFESSLPFTERFALP